MQKLCMTLIMLLACCGTLRAKPVALFYMTGDANSIRSFLAHKDKIDLLVPTWYSVDENGLLTGAPNPTVLETAHRHGLPVMPIVILFGKKKFHDLAGNMPARSRMNDALVREAKLHGYAGFQFDFEMTYDQQTQWTMPGPVAGWQWVNENLDYALKVVPREKLSMGIPLYGYHWYASAPTTDKATGDEKPKLSGDYIGAPDALQLATAYGAKLQWDEADHSAFFYFYRDQLREWIFYTDLRTFRDRYQLVQERKLQGFCSWVLGMEDPEIWTLLPNRK